MFNMQILVDPGQLIHFLDEAIRTSSVCFVLLNSLRFTIISNNVSLKNMRDEMMRVLLH